MRKRSKRYKEIKGRIEDKSYSIEEAVSLLKGLANSKIDETVEVSVRLGVDTKKSDQMVRGSVSLPHGTGKEKKVLVLTSGLKEEEAKEAGVDFIGGDEYIEKIQKGWTEFDVCVATPEIMPKVAKLGKILGPRGLMPNPKTGTVTEDIKKAVKEIKKGKINFKVDKTGCVHCVVGKVSFKEKQLCENINCFLGEVRKAKPAQAKGTYMKSVFVTSTMSPGIKIVDSR